MVVFIAALDSWFVQMWDKGLACKILYCCLAASRWEEAGSSWRSEIFSPVPEVWVSCCQDHSDLDGYKHLFVERQKSLRLCQFWPAEKNAPLLSMHLFFLVWPICYACWTIHVTAFRSLANLSLRCYVSVKPKASAMIDDLSPHWQGSLWESSVAPPYRP